MTQSGPTNGEGARSGYARGAVIGRFTVLGERGRGGMGVVVYTACDPELDRRVARSATRTSSPTPS